MHYILIYSNNLIEVVYRAYRIKMVGVQGLMRKHYFQANENIKYSFLRSQS